MAHIQQIRSRHLWLMKTTIEIIGHTVQHLTGEQWRTWRDGDDGWTILEIVCHLRDFEEIFYRRAQMMIAESYPYLGLYDHEQMAIDRAYNTQDIDEVWNSYVASRQTFINFFEGLTEEQWGAIGDHPERDSFDMVDALMQVGLHDTNHLEQMTRVIANHQR